MKVIIAGSRSISDKALVYKHIEEFRKKHDISEVVSGRAVGVDRIGERWAEENGIPVKVFEPDYEAEGKFAPFVRNFDMAKYADALLLVWDGSSNGSRDMLVSARERGLTVESVVV